MYFICIDIVKRYRHERETKRVESKDAVLLLMTKNWCQISYWEKKLLKWQDVFMLIQWDDRLSPVKAQLVYGMKIIIEMTLCFLATTFETQTKMYQRAFKTDFLPHLFRCFFHCGCSLKGRQSHTRIGWRWNVDPLKERLKDRIEKHKRRCLNRYGKFKGNKANFSNRGSVHGMTCIHPLIPLPRLMFIHHYIHISICIFLCLITGVFYAVSAEVVAAMAMNKYKSNRSDGSGRETDGRHGGVGSVRVEKYMLQERMSGQVDWELEISCQTQDLCSRVWKVPVCLPALCSTSPNPALFFSASFFIDGLEVSRWWPVSPPLKFQLTARGNHLNKMQFVATAPIFSRTV